MQKLHADNATEMFWRITPFFKRARKEGIYLATIEPNVQDGNYGENIVFKADLGAGKIMVRNFPLWLWCYALEYDCGLVNMIVLGMFRNKVLTVYKILFGNTPDIS